MKDNKVKIIVTGGGTAGHVMPILSISEEIVRLSPEAVIRFIGQRADKRSAKLVKKCSAINDSYYITAGKLRRFHGRGFFWYLAHPSIIIRNSIDIFKLIVGIVQSLILLIRWRPSVVFVKGGFVGLPVGLAAALLRIKIVTHDSDAVPGLTNRILAKFSAVSAVALPEKYYSKYYSESKTVQTGVPINNAFFDVSSADTAKQRLNINKELKVLFVIGGSLGAVRLNNSMLAAAPSLLKNNPNLKIIWSTGEYQHKELEAAINKLGLGSLIETKPFFDNLPDIFSASTIIVSRAGATTIAELAASQKPCIFVPNPVLTGGHQIKNADILKDNNACIVVSEQSLEDSSGGQPLQGAIEELLSNPALQKKIAVNLSKFADKDSTKKLAKLILGAKK